MKLSFRWYGDSDPVSLQYIRQIPKMHSIVTAVYDVPVGQEWDMDRINTLKAKLKMQDFTLTLLKVYQYMKILN